MDPLTTILGILSLILVLYYSTPLGGILRNKSYELFIRIFFNNDPFYFLEDKKHVTVFGNGHGVLLNYPKIKVLNLDKFEKFTRAIDISDSKKDTKFLSLKEMLKTNKNDRFVKMGFWYNCDLVNNHKMICNLNQLPTHNEKFLEWEFLIDRNALQKQNIINLNYGVSIPDMYPIKDCNLDIDSIPFENYSFRSSITCNHKIKKFIYQISFEKSINLVGNSVKFYYECDNFKKEVKSHHFTSDIFYDRFTTTIKNPRYKSLLYVTWKINERES
jgi:hypothetical protein